MDIRALCHSVLQPLHPLDYALAFLHQTMVWKVHFRYCSSYRLHYHLKDVVSCDIICMVRRSG